MRKIGAALYGLVAGVNILLGAYILATPAPEKEMVTYKVEIRTGDTVYDIVSRIATADDDVNELAWQVLQDNHIEDCANLRPGTVLTITVPRIISDNQTNEKCPTRHSSGTFHIDFGQLRFRSYP